MQRTKLVRLCAYSMVETSLATGNNQWRTILPRRDTERTEDSQRPQLFYYPLDTSEEPDFNQGLRNKTTEAQSAQRTNERRTTIITESIF